MNALIIGNGFDRKVGLNTDYISFINWMKEEGYGVGNKFCQYSEKLHTTFFYSISESRIDNFKIIKESGLDFNGEKFNILNPASNNYFDESRESRLSNGLLYVLPEIVGRDNSKKSDKLNIWYSFIQLLLFEKKHNLFGLDIVKFKDYLLNNGNWVDLEGLIQKSIEIRIQQGHFNAGIFSISSYFDVFSLANLLTIDISENRQRSKEEIYEIVWQDFLEFKNALSAYLNSISPNDRSQYEGRHVTDTFRNNLLKNKSLFFDEIVKYNKIITFNYVPFILSHQDIYYVHGHVNDKNNIVFGLDMNLKNSEFHSAERKTTFEIKLNKNKPLLKFSKIFQLLHLQVDKQQHVLSKVSSLSIIGHSIGEQDYSYFFSILDRNVDNIQLNCFWYEFNEGGNNKDSTKEALFEMLTSYEKYSNSRILHKMIFEGRIKFKEVFIPQIFNLA